MRGWSLLVAVVVVLLLDTPTKIAAKQQACVISSTSLKVPWVWPEVLLTAWVPPRNSSEYILQFEIIFGNQDDDKNSSTVLQLFHNTVNIISQGRREPHNNSFTDATTTAFQEINGEAWLNVTFEMKEWYVLTKTGSNQVLFSGQFETMSENVKEVVISGSNVTVNCDSDKLIWQISGTKAVVPLPAKGRGWVLGIYTRSSSIFPIITLGDVTFPLGLKGKKLSAANTSVPLRPYRQYDFLIECLSVAPPPGEISSSVPHVICSVKQRKSLIVKEVELSSRPTFLEVEGDTAKPFYLLQRTVPLPPFLPTTKGYAAKTNPYTTPTSTSRSGGGSSGGQGKKPPGWSGWWAALAVILAFLLIFVTIMCFVSHYHRPKIEKLDPIWYTRKMSKKYLENMNLISEASQEHLENSPIPERRPLLARSCSVVVNVEDPNTTAPLRLWNAVASGELEEVEQVLAAMTPDPQIMLDGWDTSPYEEAHRRGYCHILRVLDAFMSRQPQLPDNDMIISVMQSHARNVEAVFEAARGGQYRHGGGVDVLLRSYSLPGTVHDQHGQSLLHYAASVKLADGGPLWLATDIRSLVENHHVFVNAVDYKGLTALHALAEKATMSNQNTCWDGKAVNVGQAWVNLATLIMKLGCDPRLPDHSNRCPDEIARLHANVPLADEMLQICKNLGQINYSKCLARFKDFLEASKLGHLNQMQELLMEGVNVLPLASRNDPLQEAIQGGHRDAVFLLLSAGAPLCAHGLVGDTPFEAAHSTSGLPALFPALIRRAVCGRLEAEMNIVKGSNKIPDLMNKSSKDIKTIIEKSGHKLATELSKWMDQRPVDSLHNFNEMLTSAASLGLTLICQLMGVAGVRLNPLPNEQQPLLEAHNNNQHNTVYALCRDLKMNPYSAGVINDVISDQLRNDLIQSELMIFERKLRKANLDEVTVENLLNYANGISETGSVSKPLKIFLYLLAELSLVSLLHKTRKSYGDSIIDTVVHEASRSTMMHIAAAYGRINMLEYLLFERANHTRKTTGGLTAPHLAAARGHKECMQYIIEYTRKEEKCNLGILPKQILRDFDENIKSYHLDLLSTAELDAISSTKDDYTKTKLVISSRCEKTGISSEKCLWDAVIKEQRNIKDLITDDFISSVECDVRDFVQEVVRIDSRFKGTIVTRCPMVEKTEFFLPETFEFFCELEDWHALQEGCVSLGKNAKMGKEGEFTDTLKSSKDQDFLNGSNFRHSFYKAAQESLKRFTFKSMALVPPFLSHFSTGLCIFGIFRKKSRIHLVQVMISPVLKVPSPADHPLHKRYQNRLKFSSHEHLANNSENKWVYLLNFTYKSVLSALTEEEHMVLCVCLYFSKLLSTCWWLPRRQHRRVGCTWQTYPIGVDFPSARTLITFFFEELIEAKEGSWKRENFLEKVISVLKRAAPPAKRKVSFLNTSTLNPPLNSVNAVINFLENISMKNGNEIQEDGQNGAKTCRRHSNINKAISKNSLNVETE